MRKATIAGLASTGILLLLPAISAALNIAPAHDARCEAAPLFDSISASKADTVEITGPNARPSMISVDKGSTAYVMLRTVPDSLSLRSGKLVIALGDDGALYQGTLRIPGLRKIIYRPTSSI